MRNNYDFSKAVRNPYAKRLKKQLTIRLDTGTVEYFQRLAAEVSVPYQTLMNMYLRDCATSGRKPRWTRRSASRPDVATASRSKA